MVVAALASAAGAALATRAAEAQAGMRECFAARLYSVSTDDLNGGSMPATTARIPSGWTVIGGGQWAAEPAVILCR